MGETEQRLGVYEFDNFKLDIVERTLWRRQKRIPLGGRAFDVLAALVRQAGRLITKEELLQQAWKGRVVEEGNIHVQISTLRRLLGDKAISTVSGHGYRFELPIGTAGAMASNESNLPAALTPVVARERELSELLHLLSERRLVTIKGMGGIGKSSISVETCRRLQQSNPALRCWHVPVAASETGDGLQATILHAVDRRPKSGKAIEESLFPVLREKPTLLLLDGCEMVADTAARIIRRMLEQCPELKILCTSRKSLGLVGEAVFEVPPLPLDGARKLFLERAASASRSFDPGTIDPKALDRILKRLDGIPLAIELAASRLRAVGLKDLEQQLADRLGTLVASDRSLPDRQSTLRATLEWSYRLLSDQEKKFLNRVSIFEAPFTAEAAAYVGLGPTAPVGQAIDLITALIDKSFVTPDAAPERSLYVIADIVRQYGIEQLSNSEGAHETRKAVADFVSTKTHNALQIRETKDWNRFKRDVLHLYPDIASSIRFSIESGDLNRAVDLTHNTFFVWVDTGFVDDGLRAIQPLLRKAAGLKPHPRALLFHVAGGLSQDRGDFPKSSEYLELASRLLKAEAPRSVLLGIVLNDLGVTYQYIGKRIEAMHAYSQAQQVFSERGLLRREGGCLTNMAAMDCYLDKFGDAEAKLRRAHEICQKTQDSRGLALCLSWLSECHLESKLFDEALALAKQAIDAYPPKQDDLLSVALLNRLAVAESFNHLLNEAKRTWLMSLAALGGRAIERAQVDLIEGALSILIHSERFKLALAVHGVLTTWFKRHRELATPVRVRRSRAREATLLATLGDGAKNAPKGIPGENSLEATLEALREEFTM